MGSTLERHPFSGLVASAEQPTPFMGSHERLASDALTRRLVHPTAPVLLTKSGPLGTLIQSSGLQSCKADFSPI
ncbi:hypothetical protein CEXT_427411 [Caerostris extrusa]|uniref:Uncharacterized protein n=1 Tax=Caerostris extrusa TaxID=172846 RepID=A0AAV4TD81_CAEEX|nr:hypothetical protein CEXT_367641 [Caerostris extrusa]GIY93276.1 hypothetical protein CEXT_427411 [Caerostris extrusa]